MSILMETVRSFADAQKSYKWKVTLGGNSYESLKDSEGSSFAVTRTRLKEIINSAASSPLPTIAGVSPPFPTSPRFKAFNPSILVQEVQGLSLPNVERDAFYRGSRQIYYPSIETSSPVTLVFYQDVQASILEYINTWKQLTVRPDGTKNLPNSYKRTVIIDLLNGYNEEVYKFTLTGCFPTSMSPYTLANESSNLVLTQEISVDHIIGTIPEQSSAKEKPDLADRLKNKVEPYLDSAVANAAQTRGQIITRSTNRDVGDFL